ncbi:Mu transposase C-terminal domain-containing protein [Neorhizobium galegae]|uniref:Mu transposase C-terminal domain-containing protein n=1 Tax=Neorhizobium galegae TaxID=399 RepID=UPI002104DF3B|nr:Mu transposase C-terminal domain-containing protein [Neorhizobium galegae]MCQ1833373.1 Mu transposase C-terminal domain-containing protein [Neorhizobium galegae]
MGKASVIAYDIHPIDKIVLHDVEQRLVQDGDKGKVFQPMDESGRPNFYSNAEIATSLGNGALQVERNFYAPFRVANPDAPRFLNGISDKQMEEVAFKLEWVHRLKDVRKRTPRISSADWDATVSAISGKYANDVEAGMRSSDYERQKIHYYKLPDSLKLVPKSTLNSWVRKVDQANGDPRALIDGRGKGLRHSKFTEEELHYQGHFVRRVITLDRTRRAFLYRVMKVTERKMNVVRIREGKTPLDLGSRSHFFSRFKLLPSWVMHYVNHGEAKTRNKYTPVLGAERGYPGDIFEADEGRLDLVAMLVGLDVWDQLTPEEQEAYRKASRRFWFSIIVDRATNCVMAFRVHARAPSTDTALAAFEMSTRDKTRSAQLAGCRTPWDMYAGFRQVRLDQANWYQSGRLTGTLTDAGGTKIHPPTGASTLRGTVERIIGVIGALTLESFSGKTFSNVVVRGDIDPRKKAHVDPYQLELVFLRAIVDVYHNVRSKGKLVGMSPRQAWFEGCAMKRPPTPPAGALKRHIYGINLTRIASRQGIRLFGNYYYSEQVSKSFRDKTGEDIHIRVDLMDLGEITMFDGEHTYSVPARSDFLRGKNFWQITALLHELDLIDTEEVERSQDVIDEALLFIDQQPDVLRMAYGVASPIITQEHLDAVERRIMRPLRVTPESEYTRQVKEQDFSKVPFLRGCWGQDDLFEEDDLGVAASETPEKIAEKYASDVPKPARTKPKKQQEALVPKAKATKPKTEAPSASDRPRQVRRRDQF